MKNGLAYIRKFYGVPAKMGGRVQFWWPPTDEQKGTITGASGPYLRVRFDGEKRTAFLHPTWEITYL